MLHASDLNDTEWSLLELPMPAACALGCPRDGSRDVVEAILYFAATGCAYAIAQSPPRKGLKQEQSFSVSL